MKLYDFTIERGNYFSINIVEQDKKTLALFIYHRAPGSTSLRCIHSQYLNIDTYYQSDISKLSFIPSMNKQKFIIINFLKSYINLNEYNNQIIEINYDIIFNKCEDHNETHYFNVLIVDLNDEIFQHLINESTMSYIYAFNDSLYLSTIYTFYIKDRSEFDSCIEREEFINYLKMLYRRKYER
jgi:hypothetical protein